MRSVFLIFFLIISVGSDAGQIVTGNSCYRYSDNESLNAAREIALSMAKRDALESNSVFVETTSNVENMTLKNDLITNLAAGYLTNLKITNESEDLGLREICRSVQAELEPLEVKQQITARIRQFTDQNSDRSGLPKGDYLRVVNAKESEGKLFVVAEKYAGASYEVRLGVKVTVYDEDGYPANQYRDPMNYHDIGDINRHTFNLNGYKTYKITAD